MASRAHLLGPFFGQSFTIYPHVSCSAAASGACEFTANLS